MSPTFIPGQAISATARSRMAIEALRTDCPDARCIMEPEYWFTYGPRLGGRLVAIVDGDVRDMPDAGAVRGLTPGSYEQWHEPQFFELTAEAWDR